MLAEELSRDYLLRPNAYIRSATIEHVLEDSTGRIFTYVYACRYIVHHFGSNARPVRDALKKVHSALARRNFRRVSPLALRTCANCESTYTAYVSFV